MAKMYPNRLLDETKSAAESKLYELFRQQLSDDFTVFHSVAWQAHAAQGRAYDGEADFLIAHPDLGVLVLEVKGGRISFDGHSGEWMSTDRYGRQHPLGKSPFVQAKDACYNLVRKLRESSSTARYGYAICHGVCFPDVTVKGDLRPDAPKSIIIDQQHLTQLEQAVRSLFTHWNLYSPHNRPGPQGIQALIDLLAPKIELRSYLGAEFQLESEQIKKLTEEQFDTLDMLSRERRAIVYGCAGSGKTMLALEKARRLTNEGYAVLFTCFNTRLADWLRTTPYAYEGVTIVNFHKLCTDLAKRARIIIPPLHSSTVEDDVSYYFDTMLPNALLEATHKLGPLYNALVVDEGQDFIDAYWVALESILTNPGEDAFYIFCDDNQNIYAGAEQNYPFRSPSITLRTNCRNTRAIHNAVARYYRGPVAIKPGGPEGREPELITLSNQMDLKEALRKRLYELVHVEQVVPGHLIILSPKSERTSALKEGMALGNFRLTWQRTTQPNQIECATIHSFKGLERPVVLLVELDQLTSQERNSLVYIGTSRAMHHLIVFGESTLRAA